MHELLEKFTKFAGEYFVNMNHEGCEISGLEYSAELRNLPDLHEVFQQNFDVGNSNKLFYFNANHLGSGSLITDGNGNPYQTLAYAPYGEVLLDVRGGSYNEPHQFTGHERDQETGLNYAHARYYWSDLSIFTSVDPLAEKYPNMSPYVYCGNDPINRIDPTGMEWLDADGNKIEDHSKIQVYIFYDPKSFGSQSEQMYKDAVAKYGAGSVAMSNVTTMSEFAQDWGDMASNNIKEVNLNYHGNNQTVMLNSSKKQYITATGDGKTNVSGTNATNVQDLPMPSGNIDKAQLNLNTCKSNSKTQYELKGNKQTLMEAFYNSFNFKTVRGTDKGVSYWYWFSPNRPHPQDDGNWQYLRRPSATSTKYHGVGLPPK